MSGLEEVRAFAICSAKHFLCEGNGFALEGPRLRSWLPVWLAKNFLGGMAMIKI